jgi:type I restriction enzyme S subunit
LVPIGHTGVVGSTFTKLKASDLISSKYLFHFLNERFSWIQNNRTGTGVPHVPKDLNRILIIKYPEKKEEQIEIARIIDTVDGVIELTLTSIAKCQAIKQGILHDLFTRGIEIQTGKLRPKYNDAPELYKESKLGMVPKEWDEIPLEELSTQIGDGIHTTPKYADNTNYYFINGNNLLEGEIIIDDSTLSVSFDEYKKHFKELNDKTILYSINGTIGNIALYRDQKVILGKSACYISCKSSVNLDYIFFALQTEEVFKFFENEMTGSTIKNLSLASIRATPIRIPKEKSEQNQIANKVRGITEKLRTEQTYLLKLQQLKAGLMGDLLSGKKKVKLSIGVD